MKKFLIYLLLPVLLAVSCPSSPVSKQDVGVNLSYVPKIPDAESDYPLEPMSGKTAFDYFKDEKLLIGWNVGNTLDAYVSGRASETGWGNPRINRELMDGVKKAGFNIIRIPVTWMGHIGPAPDHHIDEKYLARVAEVVQMANKAGLKAIINLHHDGSTESGGRDNGWLSINKARASKEGYNEVTHKFARVWKQIAAYFRNYGDWLIFESMNEIHDGRWGEGGVQGTQTDIINDWNRFFTEIVRETGANNASRYVVIPAYCTKPKHTLANYFWLPPDSAPDRQIVTFHYYDPYEFGIAGTRSEWGSDSDKDRVVRDFAPFKSQFIDNKIPVIIGECGAVRQSSEKARQSRLDYLSWVFGRAKENGLVPIYWDNGVFSGNGEKFGLFSRSTGQPNSPESEACIKVMIEAVK
ncbi:MAG: glycoside hydrolase family 5 protein [Treponema sp.]|jgi:endoglucanase|nr:glycoside hydrolase family 5 protein [Treponema sp.]